jgi:hypothetical protein
VADVIHHLHPTVMKHLSKRKLPGNLKPKGVPRGKQWCFICKILVSKWKGGVEKHHKGGIHRRNLQETVSICKPVPEHIIADDDTSESEAAELEMEMESEDDCGIAMKCTEPSEFNL